MDNKSGLPVMAIVPEEMWEEIFSHCYSPIRGHPRETGKAMRELVTSDLLTLSRVCKDFERMLKPTETTWLFQEVHTLHSVECNLY